VATIEINTADVPRLLRRTPEQRAEYLQAEVFKLMERNGVLSLAVAELEAEVDRLQAKASEKDDSKPGYLPQPTPVGGSGGSEPTDEWQQGFRDFFSGRCAVGLYPLMKQRKDYVSGWAAAKIQKIAEKDSGGSEPVEVREAWRYEESVAWAAGWDAGFGGRLFCLPAWIVSEEQKADFTQGWRLGHGRWAIRYSLYAGERIF
jgi:hypothetical protein